MKRVCIYCKKVYGEKPPFGGLEDKFTNQETHGICPDCMRAMDADNRAEQLEIDRAES